MSDVAAPLVAGDRFESSVRRAYGRVLEASLPLVRELAEADASEPPPAPPAPGATAPWRSLPDDVPEQVRHARRSYAREQGWLLTAANARPPTMGPLNGFDVGVKDLIDVAGFPVHNGTPGGLWRVPTTSAPAWRALQGAGARFVGKTATHEMAWGVTTPQIGNPHDRDRVAGGSSGGSAASVATGAADAALGTDTGGSIRIPAALCGVVGIRPTHGTVSLDGVTPLAPSQDVVGPLAPDVATAAVLLETMTGRLLGGRNDPSPKGLRIGAPADPGSLDAVVGASYENALLRLADLGVEVVECPTPLLRDAGALSVVTMLAESAALHADAVRCAPGAFGSEARALLTIGSDAAASGDLLLRARATLRSRTAAAFAHYGIDAFVTPTTPCVAPPRDQPTIRLGDRDVPVATALSRFTAWSAATGWPAITVPLRAPTAAATTGTSLPCGLQVMARSHREDICLRVGSLVEDLGSAEAVRSS